jgi:D-glycero-D-manno-heptose 1,7-bisphosphate phosphatase
MARPAVFFDRDNTLIANGDYLGDPDGVVLLPGAAEAVARVRRLGFATVVVSNQSGVGRGMFTEDDVRAVNARMDAALLEVHPDALIESHEFSPHHPDATVDEYRGDHRRRKPQPGMIIDAAREYDLDLSRSWLIGDAPRDVEAGHRAGCRTILLRESLESISIAAGESMRIAPDYIASSLSDAVDFIEMHHETTPAVDADDEDDSDDPLSASSVDEPLIATMDPPPAPPPIAREPISVAARLATPIAGPATPEVEVTTEEPAVESFAAEQTAAAPVSTTPVSTSPALGAMKAAITSSAPPTGSDRQSVMLLERIVEELRRGNDPPQDFSVARMLAGIVQGFAIASLFAALLFRDAGGTTFTTLMLLAIFLQAMVSSLVLMGR